MIPPFTVRDVRFTAAPEGHQEDGLLGYVAATLGPLRLDGIMVRRTAEGRLALSFPARRDGAGRQRFCLRPFDDRARRDFEHQVFQALGLTEAAPR